MRVHEFEVVLRASPSRRTPWDSLRRGRRRGFTPIRLIVYAVLPHLRAFAFGPRDPPKQASTSRVSPTGDVVALKMRRRVDEVRTTSCELLAAANGLACSGRPRESGGWF
jgi:hypothetical protein